LPLGGATDWRKQPDNASAEREFDGTAIKAEMGCPALGQRSLEE
jgi:hypothetical protein